MAASLAAIRSFSSPRTASVVRRRAMSSAVHAHSASAAYAACAHTSGPPG